MKKIVFLILLTAISINVKSQCTSCTINVTDIDTTSYTLISGQTLCVDTNGVILGTIVLSGGSICNNGVFRPASFTYSAGSINNIGNMTINSDLSLPSGSSLSNSITGIISLSGSIILNGTSISNSGIMNITQNIQFNSGTFNNENIINVNVVSGSGSINNTGTLNSN